MRTAVTRETIKKPAFHKWAKTFYVKLAHLRIHWRICELFQKDRPKHGNGLFPWILTCFFLLCLTLHSEPFYYFVPSAKWLIVDPEFLSKRVKIGFLDHSHKPFSPSINLALEKTDITQAEYIKIVKQLHQADISNQWRDLGYLETHSGSAHLAQIDLKNRWGQLKILQSILVRDGYAFIMTGVARQKDFAKFQESFLAMFRSLSVTEDCYASIEDPKRKSILIRQISQLKEVCLDQISEALSKPNLSEKDKFLVISHLFEEQSFYTNHLLPFEKFLNKNYNREGLFWQTHVIHHIQNEILNDTLIQTN